MILIRIISNFAKLQERFNSPQVNETLISAGLTLINMGLFRAVRVWGNGVGDPPS